MVDTRVEANKQRYVCQVKVTTEYLETQSDPKLSQYVYRYTVTITNTGEIAAQLISRHWVITNEHQQVQEVKGLGVVGEQPLIAPGASYHYSSGTVLTTPTGYMHGSYQMVAEDGTWFEAPIATFGLHQAKGLH